MKFQLGELRGKVMNITLEEVYLIPAKVNSQPKFEILKQISIFNKRNKKNEFRVNLIQKISVFISESKIRFVRSYQQRIKILVKIKQRGNNVIMLDGKKKSNIC